MMKRLRKALLLAVACPVLYAGGCLLPLRDAAVQAGASFVGEIIADTLAGLFPPDDGG